MSSKPLIYGMFVMLWLALTSQVQADSPTNRIFLVRADKAFLVTQEKYLAATNSTTNALSFAQAAFNLADLATNDDQRADAAQSGIAVCRQWLARETNSAAGHYYLAMNLGQLAKAKAPSLTAYRLVHEVEREFLTAADLDVQVDHAGPARTLGLLYFQAPGWPFSIGNDDKARVWLERAVQLAPDYPGNELALAAAQLKWQERAELEATLKKLDAIWPAAQTNLTGEDWEQTWQEWSAKRTALKTDFERMHGAKP